ncbi:MAG: L,D-transpeptidase ErfK/SrfK [Thermoleophilaceae bacterium]|jgi:lipoprotein-anchoring transpeptidase ErfK/SrfK|nr:L,D-transpeptidase ErfK/SrfK [Thermoleophilaceae bacterium]
MRQKSFILVAALLLILAGGAVAAYAYDTSRDDLIADGVTVGGVDVGGMSSGEARRLIARELSDPLERPISVVRAGQRFSLSAQDAGVHADVDGMVEQALAQSRDGSIFSRVARDLTGGREDAHVSARVTYDHAAIDGLVDRVRSSINRKARDAEVDFPSLQKVEERNGMAVRARVLRQRLAQALTVPGVQRRVKVPVRITRPKVTQAELANKYPVMLVADRNNFQLRLYKQLTLVKEYSVAVGAVGFDTPAGLYHIQNKAVDPTWTVPDSDWAGDLAGQIVPPGPENPLKARWLGIYDGAGIHGTEETYSLGSAASHGCIRMAVPDVIELYDQVPVGAPIYIA